MDLVAIYHCGMQTDAALAEVLSRFRAKYPACQLKMLNDGGDDLLMSFAKMFHCEYVQCCRVSSHPYLIELASRYDAVKYVERLMAAIPDHDCWVLLLEDDVWIYNQVILNELKYDMCGGYGDTKMPRSVVDAIGQHRDGFPIKNVKYVKSSGAFLRASFMRGMRSNKWRKYVETIFDCERSVTSGQLLSALVYMKGGTVGPYSGYFEPSFLSYKCLAILGKVETRCKVVGNERKKFSEASLFSV